MLCSVPQGPHQRQSEAGTFDHWCLPCTCCLTRLNCYIVTSGSAICNNVTSSAAMQVCKHGFTNLVSNVMSKWNFYYIIINISMLKLSLTWHMKFFNDFHWFSMTFPGKLPFFQVNIKFHDFSSQGLNSMTFPGLCEPCSLCFATPSCLLASTWNRPKPKTMNILTFSFWFSQCIVNILLLRYSDRILLSSMHSIYNDSWCFATKLPAVCWNACGIDPSQKQGKYWHFPFDFHNT